MHLSKGHIAAITRLLLVVFLLANAGFTFVLQQCSMGESSDGMACCDGRNPSAAGACANTDPEGGTNAALADGNASCMVLTVVGGLQADPKIVEKDSKAPHIAKVDVLPIPASIFSNGPHCNRQSCLNPSSVSWVSPLSVEKYVLTASFLI